MNNDCIVFCQRHLADNIHHAGARWVRRVCVWVHVAMENGDGSSRVYCNRYMHETDEEQYWDGYRRIHCHNQSVAEMPAADAAVAGQKKNSPRPHYTWSIRRPLLKLRTMHTADEQSERMACGMWMGESHAWAHGSDCTAMSTSYSKCPNICNVLSCLLFVCDPVARCHRRWSQCGALFSAPKHTDEMPMQKHW